MKQKLLLLVTLVLILFQTAILPVNATGRWDYVLKNYSNPSDQQVVNNYLNEFHNMLKDTWYSPLYRRINARAVIFYLNKDGHISDIQILNDPKYGNFSYSENYDKHLYQYLSELKFKPFPLCVKDNKIKMGYSFVSSYTTFYTMFGEGAILANHGQTLFDYVATHNVTYAKDVK